jgi:hypothetical protein
MAYKLVIKSNAQAGADGPAPAKSWSLMVVDDADNSRANSDDLPDTLFGSIILEHEDTKGSDDMYHAVKLREMDVCVDGETKKIIVLCSDVFDPAP